jgi:hypothetical protein
MKILSIKNGYYQSLFLLLSKNVLDRDKNKLYYNRIYTN